MTEELLIKSPIKNFQVLFSPDFGFVDQLAQIPNSAVIAGKVVYGIYKDKIFSKFDKKNLIVIPLTEQTKTLDTAIYLYKKLSQFPSRKNLTIISFGGGINQDVVGFAASTLYRGVHWIYVPTTLLAQADSAIGLKTSLNFLSAKNLIGTFYPPDKIYISVKFLKTLKKIDYQSGIGEIAKLLLMSKNSLTKLAKIADDLNLLRAADDNKKIEMIIMESIKIKSDYMRSDEFDRGRRNLLNYGHELGHALESTSDFAVPHGIAVMLGIIFANLVSMKKGWLDRSIFGFINKNIIIPNIPSEIRIKKDYFEPGKTLQFMRKDKKRISDKLVLVLPDRNLVPVKITDYEIADLPKNMAEFLPIIEHFLV